MKLDRALSPDVNKTVKVIAICCSVLLLLLPSCSSKNGQAEIIMFNGKIVTVDSAFSIQEAVALGNGEILAVGKKDDIMEFAGDSTAMIDLKGHSVVPGLIDAHAHPVSASVSEYYDSIPDVNNINELLTWIKKEARRKNDGEWIIHPKFFITRMEDMRQITLRELDEAAPNNPVFLDGSFGGVVNSQALALSGMNNRNHPGILKDAKTGKPSGLIRSSAFDLLAIPENAPLTPEQRSEALQALLQDYNRIGITSIYSGGGPIGELRAFESLMKKNTLSVRVFQNIYLPLDPQKARSAAVDTINNLDFKTGDGNEWVKVGALKVVLDGGMLTGTAFLQEGWGPKSKELYGINDPNYRGELRFSKKELVDIITAAAKRGWKFTAHVTGGGGVDTLIAAYEIVNKSIPIRDRRFSIIHGNFFTPEAIQKMASLGIYADMQPAWFFKDTDLLHYVLGSDRIKTFHPYRSLIDAGIVINAGSDHMVKADPDASVNPYNPFTAMWSVVTRKTQKGTVFNPEQAISREDALRMYTINNAYGSFEEDVKGSIEKGKYADLVVLSDDLLTCEEDAIKDIKPILTIVDGRIVYDSHTLK
jgi:predicted amidohydrolase YtcJ